MNLSVALCSIVLYNMYKEVENMKFYTSDEVAELLQISKVTVQRKLASGEIKGYKLEKQWRIEEKDLKEYLEKRSNK